MSVPDSWALEDPPPRPPSSLIWLPGLGEIFVRDSGGEGPPILLLHGWMFSADLNWGLAYGALADAGYRVIAVDHRGHGRGIRATTPFRLHQCADDAAKVLEALDCGPVIAVGYSMGGPITALLARDHPDRVRATVYCATATNWQEPHMRRYWRLMGPLRVATGLWSVRVWRRVLLRWGLPDNAQTTWIACELTRGSPVDLAEAGRELSRFDSRPWIGTLDVPSAVVVTTRDTSVPPRLQRELAAAVDGPTFDVDADHFAVTEARQDFNDALVRALAAVRGPGSPDPPGQSAAPAPL